MTSKKLLVSFNTAAPHAKSSDFLVPVFAGGVPRLIGLQNRRFAKLGMMVYLGRDVSTHEILERLSATGQMGESEDKIYQRLESYLRKLQSYRIGNILAIEPSIDDEAGFELRKIANTPSAAAEIEDFR